MKRLGLRERSVALLLTLAIHVLIALIALTNWTRPAPPLASDALSTFDIAVPDIKPEPAQPEQKPQRSVMTATPPRLRPIPPITLPGPAPLSTTAVAPAPPVRALSASPPAPPAAPPAPAPPPQAGATKAAWESLVLARIERAKRYPRVIGSRRPTGTVTVEFRVNRSGALLDVKILRSSGNAALDRAAVDAVSRAAPYPAIPDDRASELTLSVPVIFLRAP